jgi:hypothetical protein
VRDLTHAPALRTQGYVGLDLAGAKNQKTSLAVLEYYPRENKIFLLDIYDKISGNEEQSSDEVLIDIINELKNSVVKMGVNVPLSLPPCTNCTKKKCPLPAGCKVPAVKWMRETARRASHHRRSRQKMKEFTPYTQRPVELYVKHNLLPSLWDPAKFEIDEALGGNKAPLTVRMSFLKRHLEGLDLVEVWPKLSLAILADQLGIGKKTVERYRQIEDGAGARAEILDILSRNFGIFIYERDQQKLARNLAAFDAFICAYTALLSDSGRGAKRPTSFPADSGWVEFPKTERG